METITIKKRFSLWRIFWVVLSLNVLLLLLAVLVMSIAPVDKEMDWGKFSRVDFFISQCASIIFSTGFYFFTLNSFYRLMAGRASAVHFLRPIGIAILVLSAYYFLNYQFLNPKKMSITVGEEGIKEKFSLAILMLGYAMSAVFYLGASLLISYFTFLRDEKKQRKVLEEQKMQLEVEKSQANFNFLKAQINPHFLHNTLNFLYAKSLPYSHELSEGILTLSDIMRYALSEGNTKDGKTLLKDEIEHMRNVIKINQLRFSNQLNVQFNVEGVINGATIIPFVLITLVENAFKHGDLKNMESPIEILTRVQDSSLYFYCRNRKKTGPKELSTGIGLNNIKKRLELAYGKNHELKVKDDGEFYTTELTINQL
jgi:two-component system LytT family sensor kinase